MIKEKHNKLYKLKNPKDIQIKDFTYDLPDERIAKFPLAHRDESKLLIYNKGVISDDIFKSLVHH